MADSTDRVIAAAVDALERQVEAQAAEGAEYGRLVERFPGGRLFVRAEADGCPVSSLVLDPANGQRVVCEVVGIDARCLT